MGGCGRDDLLHVDLQAMTTVRAFLTQKASLPAEPVART
jgi:hypothetical protein